MLYCLKAIDSDGKLTELGREMGKFPLDPCYSKCLIGSHFLDCEEEVTTVYVKCSWCRCCLLSRCG